MKRKIIKSVIFCIIIVGFLLTFIVLGGKYVGESPQDWTEEKTPVPVSVETICFSRISRQKIQIAWSDEWDELVSSYILKKRNIFDSQEENEWKVLTVIPSDGNVDNVSWSFLDELPTDDIQRYEYRVDVELCETVYHTAVEGKVIPASNVKICIDPGHYNVAREVADADEYGYVEGNFVLAVSLELRQILKEEYGIDVSMTRDSDSITLNGYTDDELDSAHISLRGEYALEEDCDLFVSLHTNSNEEDANDYPTYFQPTAINKPIILVNQTALTSDVAIEAANAIGENLSEVNFELGLAVSESFDRVTAETMKEWTKEYNDGLNQIGTVLCRTGKKGASYGVLRGASNVNVPGMIIEHGFHSVQELRREAIEGNLKEAYARADAAGIASGFGF